MKVELVRNQTMREDIWSRLRGSKKKHKRKFSSGKMRRSSLKSPLISLKKQSVISSVGIK